MDILQTGDLRRIGYEKTEDVEVINVFQGIYGVGECRRLDALHLGLYLLLTRSRGVGRHTAFMWYASGCRTLDDIRARKGGIKLSSCQEIGLTYYAGTCPVPSNEQTHSITFPPTRYQRQNA